MKKFKIGASFLLLIFACVLMKNITLLLNYILALILHELAHIYIALRRGYKLQEFKISMFGVSVKLNQEIEPQDEFSINLAGPAINLFICVCCLATYWLFPKSYFVLNSFCVSNLILAVFNLIPVYPLDGGKIFVGIIKNEKKFRIVNMIIRICFGVVFFVLFLLSFLSSVNYFYLLMSGFFLVCYEKKQQFFTILKRRKTKNIEKVEIIKVNEDINIFQLLKYIKTYRYIIFFNPNLKPKYVEEDKIIELSLKYPLTTKLKDITLG